MPPVKEILSNMGKTCRFVTKTNLSTTVSSFQTSIIALLTGCLPVSPRWTNLKTFRSVRYDLSAMTLYLITQNYWKCGSQGVKLMTLPCMAIEVYKCGNNTNPQYLNEMFTLKKCRCDLRDNSLQERPAARLTNYGFKSFKSYGAKIWNLLPATYKMGASFDTFKNMIKTWSGPTCKCSVCCLFTTWLSNHIHVW